MLDLRGLLWGSLPQWMAYRPGWNPINNSSHCTWSNVKCNSGKHVVSL